MAANGDRIVRWVRSELEKVPSASRFVLRLTAADAERSEVIGKWNVPASFDPKTLAEELGNDSIMGAAQDLCKGLIGVVKLTVQAFVFIPAAEGSAKRKHALRNTTKMSLKGLAASEEPDLITESEPANKKGVVAMFMRHTENLMSMNHQMMGALTEGVREENQNLRKRVGEMELASFEMRKLQETLLDKSMERRFQIEEQTATRERKDMFLKKLSDEVVPQVAQQIPTILKSLGLGDSVKGLLPGGDPLQTKVREIFGELAAADRWELLGQLPPAHRDNLFALLSDNRVRDGGETSATVRGAFFSLSEDNQAAFVKKLPEAKQEEMLSLLKA